MAILTPMWLQNGSYPARYDRLLIQKFFGDRELILQGLVVSQNGAGNLSVNISIGAATIIGDDQTDQGMYLVYMDAITNLVMPAAPGANKRIDRISLRVNDPQAGGPAGDNGSFVVTQGTVAASPVAPATPTSAIPIEDVLRTAGDAAVLTAQLTDIGARGVWPYTVSTGTVPGKLPANYVFFKVA